MPKYFSLYDKVNQLKDFVSASPFNADLWDAKSVSEQAETLAHFASLLAEKSKALAVAARENSKPGSAFQTMKKNYLEQRTIQSEKAILQKTYR